MLYKFNPLIFKIQKRGGISTLWGSLLDLEKSQKIGNIITQNFLGENIQIIKPSRFIFARKDSLYLNSYHIIKIGPGLSLNICHDLMEERKIGILSYIKRIYIYLAYLSANKIVCISEKTRDEFKKFYPRLDHKCCVISNPLPYKFTESKPNFHQRINEGNLNFLYVGNRNGEKNFEEGVKALCNSKIKNFHLKCVGNKFTDKEESNWSHLIKKNRLTCLGNVTDEELINLYIKSDFLFLPSRDEGFGFPIIETLSQGTPLLIIHSRASSIVDPNCYFILKSTTSCKDLHNFLINWIDIGPNVSNKIRAKFNLNLIKKNYRKQIENMSKC